MTVELLAVAEAELAGAMASYDDQQAGPGAVLADEVQLAIDRIAAHPEAWQPLTANLRRCRLRRFPYGLIYTVRDELVLVVAVMHLHRAPVRWEDRLGGAR